MEEGFSGGTFRQGNRSKEGAVSQVRLGTPLAQGTYLGEMSEWFKVPVLKTGEAQASGGSNPSLSATSKKGMRTQGSTRVCEARLELATVPKGKPSAQQSLSLRHFLRFFGVKSDCP